MSCHIQLFSSKSYHKYSCIMLVYIKRADTDFVIYYESIILTGVAQIQ